MVISEVNSTQDSIFPKSIQKLGKSANIQVQLSGIYALTLAKKEKFNEIREEHLQKQEKLAQLLERLSELNITDLETKEIEAELAAKRNDLLKVRKNLTEEYLYSDTLRHILSRIRDLAKKAGVPITIKNEDIFRINLDLKKDQREIKQAWNEVKQLKRRIKKWKTEIKAEKLEKTQGLNYKLKIYEDQQRLKMCLQLEKKRQNILAKNKQNLKKLHDFNLRIAEVKQENIIEKDLIKLNRHMDYQERKFKAIQIATYSSNVEDILPYYLYLMANKENLEGKCEKYLQKIEGLCLEKSDLSRSLKKLQLEVDYKVNEEDFREDQEKCVAAENEITEKEANLEKLFKLNLTAVNTLSRIAYQLSDEKTLDIHIDNISIGLGFCVIRLEKIMEVVQSYQNVYYIESVNTDMQYKSPPSYLKLMNLK